MSVGVCVTVLCVGGGCRRVRCVGVVVYLPVCLCVHATPILSLG